jgi:hypothetical protein
MIYKMPFKLANVNKVGFNGILKRLRNKKAAPSVCAKELLYEKWALRSYSFKNLRLVFFLSFFEIRTMYNPLEKLETSIAF